MKRQFMISTSNLTLQFGKRILFKEENIKFTTIRKKQTITIWEFIWNTFFAVLL